MRSPAGRQAGLTPVLDPSDIHASLPPKAAPPAPDPAKVEATVQEFLRVMGLLVVGAGRREHVLLVKGLGILRDLLIDLMHEENPPAYRGGALHISRTLSPEDLAVLKALPYPGPDRDALIAAHGALAAAFLPRAQVLCGRLGVDWPVAFEAATRRYLAREVGLDLG